ncbi:LysR family transcriptional regulator [Yinghuangia sp. YIM S10712]|uniref:LysR family transcriptional regulator n=1 Tax=Yinghuangia sp. YIM S10712 TaxID=3436930 RepID=UPI003F52B51A
MGAPAPLLDTTLDQLRTLIAVHAAGTALGAARILGREQSSVQKQIDTLNRNFLTLCGEPLVLKQGRGKDVLFTGTGEALVDMAHTTLGDWSARIRDCRARVDRTLTVGATRYTLGVIADACADIAPELQRTGVELKVEHVRTRDLLGKLRGKEVDLVCGSLATRAGDDGTADCDVLELARGGLHMLTNLATDQVPDAPIAASTLPKLPLVVPNSGLISDFLRGWFGPDYRDRLTIVAEIDAVPFGLELLGSRLPVDGCMLVTQGLGAAVGDNRVPGSESLRGVDVFDDTGAGMEVLVGVFARKGDRAQFAEDHPLNLVWNAVARRIQPEGSDPAGG